MVAVVFPATLPGPGVATITPAERRLLSDLPGPQNVRGIQRDYLATQQLEWNLLDATAAAAFQAWWKVALYYGCAWFSAAWPMPAGWGSAVRRFIAPPKWQHLAGGFWRVTAECEVRGRGLAPNDCFRETFTAGVGPYGTVSGNAGLFTAVATPPYGQGVAIAAPGSGIAAIVRRAIPARLVSSLSVKVMLTSLNTDDAGELLLTLAGVLNLGVVPAREAAFDALQRVQVSIGVGGSLQPISAASLALGVWHQIDISIVAGSGNSSAVLTRLSDGVVLATTPLAGSFTPANADGIDLFVDASPFTSADVFADLHLC